MADPHTIRCRIDQFAELLACSAVGPGAMGGPHPAPWRAVCGGNRNLPWLVLDARGDVIAKTTEPIAILLAEIEPWLTRFRSDARHWTDDDDTD